MNGGKIDSEIFEDDTLYLEAVNLPPKFDAQFSQQRNNPHTY